MHIQMNSYHNKEKLILSNVSKSYNNTLVLEDINIKLDALRIATQKYYDEGVKIIETLKNAYWLYKQQPNEEKRKFLNYLLSNCTLEGEKVSYNYNLPFSYFVNFDSCRKKYAIQVMKTEN